MSGDVDEDADNESYIRCIQNRGIHFVNEIKQVAFVKSNQPVKNQHN